VIEIAALNQLQREVFGPVIHVLRFAASDLPDLVAQINETGYGLTLGIHSRIDETIQQISEHAHVGNIYVNRNMVGAVVGVQPFGGEGLSGTGPKAGGPLYLQRLADNIALPAMAFGATPEVPALLTTLAKWAAVSGRSALAACCAEYGRDSLLHVEVVLPGPTGERNTLRFAPRGRLLCRAAGAAELLLQLAAVLATGNQPVLEEGGVAKSLLAELPPTIAACIELRPAGNFAGLAGVLGADDAGVLRALAACNGPLLLNVRPADTNGRYPLYRLFAERVISVNTTAAGGNTTLMTLST
jgi:RHH-type proline utilization regulon transcriptional repressor/proline dehydrogenase/delta 1-pyrroline-5-carboxylate dehydrogenase